MRAADTTGSARLIESGDSRELWQGTSGTLRLRWNGRGAIETTVREHGGEELVDIVTQRMESSLREAQRVQLFFDLGAMHSYDSAMRVRWTEWLKKHLSQVDRLDVIARSKIVTMGVAVANLALGGIITVHSGHQGSYDAALSEAGLPPRS
jgi:hypothetical protein